MRKFKNIWIALFVGLCVSLVYAGVTNIDDLQLDGNDLLDSSGVTRVTVGTTNTITGNATVTGNSIVSGTLAVTGNSTLTGTLDLTGAITITTGSVTGLFAVRSESDPNTSVTPSAVGQLMFDSSTGDLCVSTAAAIASWVLVSTPTVACAS